MKYVNWLWWNSRGIRWNTMVRIVAGIGQVVLGLLMVWLSKRFIDETIRTGTADDVLRMVELLVLTVVGDALGFASHCNNHFHTGTTSMVMPSSVICRSVSQVTIIPRYCL